jgi:hypothetical protein
MRTETSLVVILAGLIACGTMSARAEEETPTLKRQFDWCTIEVPATAVVGEPHTVTITIKELDPELKVRADLHYRKQDGSYGGFNRWGGEAQTVPENKVLTFTIKPKPKDDMVSVHALVFASPTGEHKDRVKSATGPDVPVKE